MIIETCVLYEQIRASECMQHVIIITSTDPNTILKFHAAGEKDHLQKSVKSSF